MLVLALQEKQAAEVSQQTASDSSGLAAADEEAQLQQQLQELSAKIADLDEGETGSYSYIIGFHPAQSAWQPRA
jgi:hypothetical protein